MGTRYQLLTGVLQSTKFVLGAWSVEYANVVLAPDSGLSNSNTERPLSANKRHRTSKRAKTKTPCEVGVSNAVSMQNQQSALIGCQSDN